MDPCSIPQKLSVCWETVENSSHLSIAPFFFSKATASSFSLIGKAPSCSCVVAVSLVHLSQSPLFFAAFVAAHVLRIFSCFFSVTFFTLTVDGQTPNQRLTGQVDGWWTDFGSFWPFIRTTQPSTDCTNGCGQSPLVPWSHR
jgi:hypothetical protein